MIVALLDAGPMIALFDAMDKHHVHFRDVITRSQLTWRLHTTWPCVTEATHMLGDRERLALLRWIGVGAVQVYPFDTEDLLDMADWMGAYTDARCEMDLADASLYWAAHETGVNRILTLDVRDFSRYRLPSGKGFEIL